MGGPLQERNDGGAAAGSRYKPTYGQCLASERATSPEVVRGASAQQGVMALKAKLQAEAMIAEAQQARATSPSKRPTLDRALSPPPRQRADYSSSTSSYGNSLAMYNLSAQSTAQQPARDQSPVKSTTANSNRVRAWSRTTHSPLKGSTSAAGLDRGPSSSGPQHSSSGRSEQAPARARPSAADFSRRSIEGSLVEVHSHAVHQPTDIAGASCVHRGSISIYIEQSDSSHTLVAPQILCLSHSQSTNHVYTLCPQTWCCSSKCT